MTTADTAELGDQGDPGDPGDLGDGDFRGSSWEPAGRAGAADRARDDLRRLLSYARWRLAVGYTLAAVVVLLGAHQWYTHNTFAQLVAHTPAVSLEVDSVDPVIVVPATGHRAEVRGAPDDLDPGSTLSVFVDATDPGVVYYARASTGLHQSLIGASWLLVCGAVGWLLTALTFLRCPRRAAIATLAAAATTHPVRVVAVNPEPAPPRTRPLRWLGHHLRGRQWALTLEHDDRCSACAGDEDGTGLEHLTVRGQGDLRVADELCLHTVRRTPPVLTCTANAWWGVHPSR